tara:strand:- start:1023 stop:1541 length:519 start_codon:yes stop_codon:yes gene_type:complete
MNKQQRHLVVAALLVGAIGLHLWFCAWGWKLKDTKYEPVLAFYTTDIRSSLRYADDMTYEEAKAKTVAEDLEYRKNNPLPADASRFARMMREIDHEPMPIDANGSLIVSVKRDETLALWPREKGARDDALLFGVLGSLGVLAAAAFVALGGRQVGTAEASADISMDSPKGDE